MSKREISVFRNRSYVLLIFSNIFNRFGDSIDAIVFTWLTYDLTGSASFSAIVFAANRFPTVILQPVAGVLIERKRKKYIMAVADVMRASLAGYILVRLITGVPAPSEMITVTFLISTVESFRQPAGYSILPSIVDKSMYSKAVSYQSGISSAAELAGMGAAGFLIGFTGNAGAVTVDVAMFALSALFLICMKTGEKRSGSEDKMSCGRFLSDLKEGVYGIKQSRVLSYLLILVIEPFIGRYSDLRILNDILLSYVIPEIRIEPSPRTGENEIRNYACRYHKKHDDGYENSFNLIHSFSSC